jgi:hypothetical protein
MNVSEMLPNPRWRRDPPRPWHTEFYTRYIGGPGWRAVREKAIAARGCRCESCGRAGPIQVHHRTYERLGHERIDDLVILCKFCHEKVHRARRPAKGGRP